MHRSNPPLPSDIEADVRALGPDDAQALRTAWALADSAAPPPDMARKAHTWSVLQREMARTHHTTRPALRRVDRHDPSAPLWRVYTLGLAASLALLVAVGLWLQPGPTHFETADAARTVTLEDGSTVTLAPHTALTLDDTWPEARAVRLDGTARFEVARDETRPFAVTTHQATVTVLGTVFTVRARASDLTHVSVESGRVAVEQGSTRVELAPEQQTMARADRPLVVRTVPASEAAVFAFDDAPARVLFEEVETLFGIDIAYPPEVGQRRLTLTRHGPLDARDLVQGITAGLGLTYHQTATGFAVTPR